MRYYHCLGSLVCSVSVAISLFSKYSIIIVSASHVCLISLTSSFLPSVCEVLTMVFVSYVSKVSIVLLSQPCRFSKTIMIMVSIYVVSLHGYFLLGVGILENDNTAHRLFTKKSKRRYGITNMKCSEVINSHMT